jgi:hypothetical protein
MKDQNSFNVEDSGNRSQVEIVRDDESVDAIGFDSLNEDDDLDLSDSPLNDSCNQQDSFGSRLSEDHSLSEEVYSLEDPYAATKLNSWDFRSRLSPREGEKEFQMFCLYRDSGSGRSTSYISLTYNLPESRVLKIAERDNWAKRAADHDTYKLQLLLKQENNQRAIEHKRKLEEYRQTQEFLGRSLSADAAKMAAIVGRALDKFIAEDRDLEIREIPGIIAAASKAADLGRNLQASSLGVDQLLVALEEMED